MDTNRMYTILESSAPNDEKRKALLGYMRYTMRKLPTDPAARRKVAENFGYLLTTNYFADVDDGEVKYVLRKASELRTDAVQSDGSWHVIEELIEDI